MEMSTEVEEKSCVSNSLFEGLEFVPISQLDPSIVIPLNSGIKARIALVYPYSSSTETAGILAADPDIRARRNGGQIHVQFKGAAARSIGASGIGIGDIIHLSLNGAAWSEEQNIVRTPTKSVRGTLFYRLQLELQISHNVSEGCSELIVPDKISRNETNFTSLSVNEAEPSPEQKTPSPSSKQYPNVTLGLQLNESPRWSSPVFLRNKNWSPPSLPSAFKPVPYAFPDNDLDVDDRPKKRTKFWRSSGQWRYSRMSPNSPESETDAPGFQSQNVDGTDNSVHPIPDAMEIEFSTSVPTLLNEYEQFKAEHALSPHEQSDAEPMLSSETHPADVLNAKTTISDDNTAIESELTEAALAANDVVSQVSSSPTVRGQPEMEVIGSQPEDERRESSISNTPSMPRYSLLNQVGEISRPILERIDTSVEAFSETAVLSRISNNDLTTPTSPKLEPLRSDILPMISPFSGLDQSSSIQQLLSDHNVLGVISVQPNWIIAEGQSTERESDVDQAFETGMTTKLTLVHDVVETRNTVDSDGRSPTQQSTTREQLLLDVAPTSSEEYSDFGLDGASMSRPAPILNTDDSMLQEDIRKQLVLDQDVESVIRNDTSVVEQDIQSNPKIAQIESVSPSLKEREVFSASHNADVGRHVQKESRSSESPRSYYETREIIPAHDPVEPDDIEAELESVNERQADSHVFEHTHIPPAMQLSHWTDRDERRSTLDVNGSSRARRITPSDPKDLQGTTESRTTRTSAFHSPVVYSEGIYSPSAASVIVDTTSKSTLFMETMNSTPLMVVPTQFRGEEPRADVQDNDVAMTSQDDEPAKSNDGYEPRVRATEMSIDPSLFGDDFISSQTQFTRIISSPPLSSMITQNSQELPLPEDDDNEYARLGQLILAGLDPSQMFLDQSATSQKVQNAVPDTSITSTEPITEVINEDFVTRDAANNSSSELFEVLNKESAISTHLENPESIYSSWTLSSTVDVEKIRVPREKTPTALQPDDVELDVTPDTSHPEGNHEVVTQAESPKSLDEQTSVIQNVSAVEYCASSSYKNNEVAPNHTVPEELSKDGSSSRPKSQLVGDHASSTPFSSLDISQRLMETLGQMEDMTMPTHPVPGLRKRSFEYLVDETETHDKIGNLQSQNNVVTVFDKDMPNDDQPGPENLEQDVEVVQQPDEAVVVQSYDQSEFTDLVSSAPEKSPKRLKKRKSSVPAVLSTWFDSSEVSENNHNVTESNTNQRFPNLEATQVVFPVTKTDLPQARPRRRSARLRKSSVPEILSGWFESRDEHIEHAVHVDTQDDDKASSLKSPEKTWNITDIAFTASNPDNGSAALEMSLASNTIVRDGVELAVDENKKGLCSFRSPLSYYYALDSLSQLLNSAPQSTENIVDVIAVVTWQSKKPKKSKAGPKDHFTILHIAQPSTLEQSTEVHVFRPNKEVLPVADKGDVMLLRNFVVKSRARQCYLLSESSSAWHVWRFRRLIDSSKQNKLPAWAQSQAILEEAKGPPVELGPEEQDHARRLKSWYEEMQSQKKDTESSIKPVAKVA